ncbi:MAG: peptidoglycan bridge formation glycyltransferase FemA/FemB family protein [Anaerolineae bacterium]|nr:peptidoglycan bridge formation glycyltransferase FemA/FemB family protein [Anaerolineae bacterium]
MLPPTLFADDTAWDNILLASFAHPPILQSSAWSRFKARQGWRLDRRGTQDGDGTLCAAAAILSRRAAPGVSLVYVPRGPLWKSPADLPAALALVEDAARKQGAIFAKIDAPIHPDDKAAQATLRTRGWRLSDEQVQFRNTLTLDLRPTEEELLAAMKQKWRYNIRLAAKKGVNVRLGSLADLPTFYTMYVETGERDGFIVRPYEYYKDAWGTFMSSSLAQLFLAEYEGEALGGIILFRYGPTAWYMYGASREAHRNLMPNYLLQWEAIRWAKAQGVTLYDWWGAPDVLDEAAPMYGVYRFKEGFGAQFVPSTGAWDFPVNKPLYRLYTYLMPKYLELRRRMHRVEAPTE